METKDWKKVINNKEIISWMNKIEDEKEIIMRPLNFHNLKGNWIVSYIEPNDLLTRLSQWKNKTFKSKLEALKYAKAYMRTH